MYAGTWIQEVDKPAFSFIGERINTVKGVLLENASIIKKGDYYYWFMGQNGDNPFGATIKNGKTSVWRAKKITGPYEGAQDIILGNNRWQCPKPGCAVVGPDSNYYYMVNATDVQRQMMCRQMLLQKMEWDKDNWPHVNNDKGLATDGTKPINPYSPVYKPDLNDSLNNTKLEGITTGVLGSKWLFKREEENAWSLVDKTGWIKLNCLYPLMNDLAVANFLCQRPTGAYYSVEIRMIFKPEHLFQQAGLAVKELCSGNGVANGLAADWLNYADTSFSLVQWHGVSEG